MEGGKVQKVVCMGAGYVGGPTMAVMAQNCPDVRFVVVDISEPRIAAWNDAEFRLPIYEPGLEEVIREVRGRNMFFSTAVEEHVRDADIIFVSVNTPTKTSGVGAGRAADLTYWEHCARTIAKAAETPKIVVEKSTVPVRTAQAMKNVIEGIAPSVRVEVLSNPEFLAEGTAISDLRRPDRVLIGCESSDHGHAAARALAQLYERWVPTEKVLIQNVWSAELSKLVANAMLAQRISSINAISAFCEASGADVQEVSRSVGLDSRIGAKFLNASVGFGGSCFQKDILNLVYLSESMNLPEVARYFESIILINDYQKRRFVRGVVAAMFNTLRGKRMVLLGAAFKKDTGDVRETPAVDICRYLMEEKANIVIVDPKVNPDDFFYEIGCHGLDVAAARTCISFERDVYLAAASADALLVVTEWDEFKSYDYPRIFSLMHQPAHIFDGRNILDLPALGAIGFRVHGVGKGNLPSHFARN